LHYYKIKKLKEIIDDLIKNKEKVNTKVESEEKKYDDISIACEKAIIKIKQNLCKNASNKKFFEKEIEQIQKEIEKKTKMLNKNMPILLAEENKKNSITLIPKKMNITNIMKKFNV